MPEDLARTTEKRRLAERIRAEMTRATGRRYERLDLDALDLAGLQDLWRFLQDADGERRLAVDRARLVPWRRA